METNTKSNKAVEDRLALARQAWKKLKNTLIKNDKIDPKLKLLLFDSLVGSVLLYGLTTIKINKTKMAQIQSFYSGCLRFLILGNYEAQKINMKKYRYQRKAKYPHIGE